MIHFVPTSNQDLIYKGKDSVSINWGQAILGTLVYMAASIVFSYIPFAAIILAGPLAFGWSLWSLDIKRDSVFELNRIFKGFDHFGNNIVTFLLYFVFVFLWTLLLIIPGIIKAMAYSQVFYILADNPEMKPMDALKKSEEMMDGSKMKYFLLSLLFGLLGIACIFTLGIGFLFLVPLMQVTLAHFYDELKENVREGEAVEEDLEGSSEASEEIYNNEESDENDEDEDIADWAK